jgi:hypothetical protein
MAFGRKRVSGNLKKTSISGWEKIHGLKFICIANAVSVSEFDKEQFLLAFFESRTG